MRSLAVLVLIAVAFFAAAGSRFIALLVYWWFATFQPEAWMWWDVESLRLHLISAMLLVVPCFLAGRLPRLGHPITYLMLAWLGLAAYATYQNGCGAIGAGWLDHMARVMLVLFLTNRLLDRPSRVFWLALVIGGSLAFFSARGGLWAFLQGGAVQYGYENLVGSMAGSNAYALATAVLSFLMLATAQNALNDRLLGIEDVRQRKVWQYGILIGMGLAVPFSMYQVVSLFSRGSALGMACGLATVFALQRRKTALVLKLLPVLLVGLAIVPVPQGYSDRVSTIFAERTERDDSSESRLHFWAIAGRITRDHPMGVGPGCYSSFYDRYDDTGGQFGKQRSVHSAHMQILTETGYLGFAVWWTLIGLALWRLLKVRRWALEGRFSPGGDSSQVDSPTRGGEAYFFYSFSIAIAALLVTFAVGGAFYELAHTEYIWLGMILTVVLERLARETTLQRVEDASLEASPGPTPPVELSGSSTNKNRRWWQRPSRRPSRRRPDKQSSPNETWWQKEWKQST